MPRAGHLPAALSGSAFSRNLSGFFVRIINWFTIAAAGRKPSQSADQFRGQLYADRVNGESALVYRTLPADNIKIAAGGLRIEDVAALVFQLFKTAQTAPFATAVPKRVINGTFCHRLPVFLFRSCQHHLPQRPHSLGRLISLSAKFNHGGLFLFGSAGRTG